MRRLSFARRVPQADLPAFERRLAAQAREAGREVAGAIIHPHVDAPEHFIVEYLWPWDEQDSIWGLDLADRPLVLAAARAAGEGGAAVASPPITLRDLPVHPEGYTLRYPVWGDADAPGQRPFVGTVTATEPNGETLVYGILSGNSAGAFAIHPATGAIRMWISACCIWTKTPAFAALRKSRRCTTPSAWASMRLTSALSTISR